ncbi:MAG: hypothetical protein U0931_41580 [Vulcanimicrobiota bacterium]
MRRRGGLALVLSLLLCAFLLVVGLALMTRQSQRYRDQGLAGRSAQALALAEAGLQDALLKVRCDINFPPLPQSDPPEFCYTEEVTGVGRYQVTVQTQALREPYWVLKVRSRGSVGPLSEPGAQQTLVGEIDCSPRLRSDKKSQNPGCCRYTWVRLEN